MKQKFLPKLLLVATLLFCSLYANAYDFSVENEEGVTMYYNILSEDDLTCEVTGRERYSYNNKDSYEGNVVIPDTATYLDNTYFVTSIGDYAFRECPELTTVDIPNSVTTIGYAAFYNCTGLTSIDIPNSVTDIGYDAFCGCSGLTGELKIPDSVTTIGGSAFENCSGLTGELKIPDSVASIGNYAFAYCSGLTSLTLGNSVTDIGYYAFANCTGLTGELKIPDSVTTIGSAAFWFCSGLTSVTIGNGVTSIGSDAFFYCTGLTSVTIGNGVTSIGETAFYNCSELTFLTYNAIACSSVEDGIFAYCDKFTKATIGENVESMPAYLFSACPDLIINSLNPIPPTIKSTTFAGIVKEVAVPMESLNKYALADVWTDIPTIYAISDDNVYYPAPIIYTGDAIVTASGGDENGAVVKKGDVVEISLLNGAEVNGFVYHAMEDITDEISNDGQYSFTISEHHKENRIYSHSVGKGNTYDITVSAAGQVLEQVTVANINSVYYLKVRGDINGTDILTIRRMPNLQILDLSEANVVNGGDYYYNDTYTTAKNTVGQYFFVDMATLNVVKLPNSATSIGPYACGNCTGLTSIEIPADISYIDTYAFAGCVNLVNLTIEDSSKSLKIYTDKSTNATPFADCPLGMVYLGRTLTYDYSGAHTMLYGKLTVTSLTLGDNVTTINDYEFYNCMNIVCDNLELSNVSYLGKYAFYCCNKISNLEVGNEVTSIGDYAFYRGRGLTKINFGSGVTSIGSYAFYACSNLKELNIPNNVKTIGESAFTSCIALTALNLGDGVTSIGYQAFHGCTGLTGELKIPDSVTTIGGSAFYNCDGLTAVTLGSGISSIGGSAFSYCSQLTTLTIGDSDEVLSFVASVFNGSPIETLYLGRDLSYSGNNSPFKEFETLRSVRIGNKATNVSAYAFYGCTSLTDVTISNNVTKIDTYAFYGCSTLNDLTIGNQVTSIGDYAFYGCEGLSEVKTPNSINTIGTYAFGQCTGLTTFTLGSSCSTINDYAFNGCSALKELYSKNTDTPSINATTFNDVDKETCVLYVPTGSLNKYWLHTYWTEFFNIQEMDFDPNDDTDGINEVATSSYNAEVTGCYTIDGKAVDAPQRGINILRYSDGTTKKVLVK